MSLFSYDFQFLTLNAGQERQQLVPVLTTMLTLSPEEKETLGTVAAGMYISMDK